MEAIFVPIIAIGTLFIGLPWLVFHYITKWKSAATLPVEDERLLDDLYNLARRLEDRMHTVERLFQVAHPDWRPAVRSDRDDEHRIY